MYSSQHKQDRYTFFQIKFMGLTAEYPAISKLYPYNSGYAASRISQGFGFGLRLGLGLGLGLG